MKHILIGFLVLFSMTSYSKITKKDLRFKEDASKGISDAVVLDERGVLDDNYSESTKQYRYTVKIKYFSEKGIKEHGFVKIYLNPDFENIGNFKGTVLRPDGQKIKLSKNNITSKTLVAHKYLGLEEITFNFEGLVPGSVVEFSYYKSSDYLNFIKRWDFQGDLYTVHSEVEFIRGIYRLMPDFTFQHLKKEPKVKMARHGEVKTLRISYEDIPPVSGIERKSEQVYERESVVFYYKDTNKKFKDFWREWGDLYYKSFVKRYFKALVPAENIVDDLYRKDNESIVMSCYRYVLSHYVPLYKFDSDVYKENDNEDFDPIYISKKVDTPNFTHAKPYLNLNGTASDTNVQYHSWRYALLQDWKSSPDVDALQARLNHFVSMEKEAETTDTQLNRQYLKNLFSTSMMIQWFDYRYLTEEQICYILVSIVKAAAPDAVVELGFYIPPYRGTFNPYLMTLDQFTDRLIKVTYKNQVYYLYPTRRFLPEGVETFSAQRVPVLLMGENGTHFEQVSVKN